jgi:hypothetical protein
MKYQPFRDEPYQRECEDRYQVIKKFAEQYSRPFSVLDVGANHGYFGQRLVEDFPNCVYFAIDNKEIDPHPRIHHIKKHLDPYTLLELSRSESFDIVLGLAVLHHMKDFEIGFRALRRLGEYAFFEICGKDDKGSLAPERHKPIAEMFERDGLQQITTFKSHKSGVDRPWYVNRAHPFIKDRSIDSAFETLVGYASYRIFQNFKKSEIEIDRRPFDEEIERRPMIAGMNAWNFKYLGGEIDIPEDDGLPDCRPWNFIIGVNGLERIDFKKKYQADFDRVHKLGEEK